MKRVLALLCILGTCACNAGKHDPITNLKDSTAANSNYEGGQPSKDKTDTLYKMDSSKRMDSSGR